MHYIVGNTSGLDIGQVPSPIDQRVGRMAQIGGSLMEIQITNPATFQIDRRELLNVINQIDLDITLHGDPNIGFTAAYATRAQGGAGYNIVHRYMKRYIEQMAGFKHEIDNREDLDFNMGYVNMHASTAQIPSLEERLASDISMDPFGESLIDFSEGSSRRINIWRNEEFMEDLFDYWFLQVVDRPWQYYEPSRGTGTFYTADENFADAWDDAKADVADGFFARESDPDTRIGLFQSIAGFDQDVDIRFLEERDDKELPRSFTAQVNIVVQGEEEGEMREEKLPVEFNTLGDVNQYCTVPGRRSLLDAPGRLARDKYRLDQKTFEVNPPAPNLQPQQVQGFDKSTFDSESVIQALMELIEDIWDSEAVSTQSKTTALSRNLDIQQNKIWEKAETEVEDEARKTFAHSSWETREEILDQLSNGRERDDFLKESSVFFQIIPAWMQNADYSAEMEGENLHPGWESPKFIWDAIVGDTFEDYEEFQDFLQESRENQLDVIAAVGCAYIWGHWTQVEDGFERQAFESDTSNLDKPELKNGTRGRYTWSEWMNKFGLKLNIEAMYGDPGQILRVWRPKDIAIVCHAINRTAKNQSENWAEDYGGPIAKFTIDMEHTASFGVDPYQEIKKLIDKEKEIASETEADSDKPLAEIMKTYHLTKPGWEQQQGHRHGPFARGDETLYKWLYKMIENGFCRNPGDRGVVMFEVGGEYREEMYVIRVAMDMIAEGIKPEDLDPNDIPLEGEYENSKQALMARFFGLDKPQFNSEWTKIQEHAFDPLDGLLEAESFDHTWTGRAALEEGGARPQEWMKEEYR